MKFSAFALLGAILASTATADVPKSSIKNVGDVASSVSAVGAAEQPTSKLPFDISVYSQAAGLAQQTYCYTRGKTGQKVGDSTLLFTTGDGIDTQRVNIYDSASLGLVVAYEGTNISSIHSILYDAEFVLVPGDSVLDLPFGSLVDQGFQSAFLKTWPLIKQQVTTLKTTHGKGKLTVVGHSLGASQASLAAFALRKQFGTVDKVVTFGLPRTGNLVYANHVDSVFGPTKFSYMINGKDPVPHLPPRLLGYQHPSGQVWINPANSTSWLYYPGQENPKGADSVIDVQISFDDHQGIYAHTQIGASKGHCPATVGRD